MVNKVILIGNLTRDAEPVDGARVPMTRMRLATNSFWRDADGVLQESTEYHGLVVFGRDAETAANYCVRGKKIYVEGRMRTREYDSSDGLRRTSTEVVVDRLKFIDRRDGGAAAATGDAARDGSDAAENGSDAAEVATAGVAR